MNINKLIIHHSLTKDSDTVSWGAIRKYHLKLGWADIGYHFGIELIGDHYEILAGRMPNVVGAHTKGQNNQSLGICLIGNFDVEFPSFPQLDLAYKLCRYLLSHYSLTPKDVYGHRDFASYKSCPGNNFDMDNFRGNL